MTATYPPSPELVEQPADWFETYQSLAAARDGANWAIADLFASIRGTGTPTTTTKMSNRVEVARVKLSSIIRIATAFPPGERDKRLPFEVHAQLACLPDETRFTTLEIAAAEGWGERRAKAAAVAFRQERAGFVDEDKEVTLAVHVMRAWNRATPEAREYFNELREVAGLGIIDEDA